MSIWLSFFLWSLKGCRGGLCVILTLLFPFLLENRYCSLLPLQVKQVQWSADMCNLMAEEWKTILYLHFLYHWPFFLCGTAKQINQNFIKVPLLLGANIWEWQTFGMTLTCFLETLGMVRAKHILQSTRAARFKDSSWKSCSWPCGSYLWYKKMNVYQYHTEIWLKSSEQGLNSIYTHLEISSFPEVHYSSKWTNLNPRRNLANDKAVQIMPFLRIFSGIYMQLSWQAMAWLHLTCLDMFLQVVWQEVTSLPGISLTHSKKTFAEWTCTENNSKISAIITDHRGQVYFCCFPFLMWS